MPKTLIVSGAVDTMSCRGPDIELDRDFDFQTDHRMPLMLRVDAGGESCVICGHPFVVDGLIGWMLGAATPAASDPVNGKAEPQKPFPDWNIYFEPAENSVSPRLVLENLPDDVEAYFVDEEGVRT